VTETFEAFDVITGEPLGFKTVKDGAQILILKMECTTVMTACGSPLKPPARESVSASDSLA
jgi:hypothetical protein